MSSLHSPSSPPVVLITLPPHLTPTCGDRILFPNGNVDPWHGLGVRWLVCSGTPAQTCYIFGDDDEDAVSTIQKEPPPPLPGPLAPFIRTFSRSSTRLVVTVTRSSTRSVVMVTRSSTRSVGTVTPQQQPAVQQGGLGGGSTHGDAHSLVVGPPRHG